MNCETPAWVRLGTRFSGNPLTVYFKVRLAKRGTCAQIWRLKWSRHCCSWKVVSLTRWEKDPRSCTLSLLSSLIISTAGSANHRQPSSHWGARTGQPRELLHRSTVPWDGSFHGFLHWLSLHSTTQAVTHLRFLDFQQARTCPPTSVLQEDWLVKVSLILIFWLFSSRPSFSVLIPHSRK